MSKKKLLTKMRKESTFLFKKMDPEDKKINKQAELQFLNTVSHANYRIKPRIIIKLDGGYYCQTPDVRYWFESSGCISWIRLKFAKDAF